MKIGIVLAVVAVVASGCSSAPATGGTKITTDDVAQIVGPPTCRRNEACEPEKFASLYRDQTACVVAARSASEKAVGVVPAKCSLQFWQDCGAAIEAATCEKVKAGLLPDACACAEK